MADGVDGKAHYVALNPHNELASYLTGSVVEVRGSAQVRVANHNIVELLSDGLYRTDLHLAIEKGRGNADLSNARQAYGGAQLQENASER